jgi:hypothetical protein
MNWWTDGQIRPSFNSTYAELRNDKSLAFTFETNHEKRKIESKRNISLQAAENHEGKQKTFW